MGHDRGRESELSALPLPPNRTGGFPASGSPVGGSPRCGLTGEGMGCGQAIEPLRRKERVGPALMIAWCAIDQAEPNASFHTLFECRQHAIGPHARFGPRPAGAHFSSVHSHGHCRRGCFRVVCRHAATFLGPFAPRPLQALRRSYGPSDSCRAALRLASEHEHRPLPPDRSPSVTHPSLVAIPSPTTPWSHIVALLRYPSARCMHRRASVRLRRHRAGSSNHVIESRSFPTDWYTPVGCSPPRLATTQLPLGYRPESVCLERICTSLDECAWRRTR